MSPALNAHVAAENKEVLAVWFTGTTALAEGQGVCYIWDGIAADGIAVAATADGRRGNYVELPSADNNMHFAGVCARAYSAQASGRLIEINPPGSVCKILLKQDVVLGTTLRVTCEAGGTYAGYFRDPGFQGEGSATPLQTVTAAATAALCLAKLEVGPPSGLVENVVANTDGLLDGGATTIMLGGVTYFDTDITIGGDGTYTLADCLLPGLKKGFVSRQTQTSEMVINVTSGLEGLFNADPTNALATIKFNADLEEATLQWNAFDTNGAWVILFAIGATIA